MSHYTDWTASWLQRQVSAGRLAASCPMFAILFIRASRGLVQEAKAAAMGPRRNRAAAREVLAEPLLSVILDQAAQAQDAGWFWTYDLKHAKVGRQTTMMAMALLCYLAWRPAWGLHLYRL